MQDGNKQQPKPDYLANLANSIASCIDGLTKSFQLAQREKNVLEESFRNIEANRKIQESQTLINAANKDIPVMLTSQQRLIVLEALIVARARDEKPLDDLVSAIAQVRANIEFEKSSNAKPVKPQETVHRQEYYIPVLSEVGNIIGDARALFLSGLLIGSLGFIVLSIPGRQICESLTDETGTYHNRSAFCNIQRSVGRFFQDYR